MASDTSSFYQSQLAILAGFCVVAVILERRAAGKSVEPGHARTGSQAENGTAGTKRTTSASALTRQYLLVYGLVMCELHSLMV